MSYDNKNLKLVLLYYWIYLTHCEKVIKCLVFYAFSSTRLLNSMKMSTHVRSSINPAKSKHVIPTVTFGSLNRKLGQCWPHGDDTKHEIHMKMHQSQKLGKKAHQSLYMCIICIYSLSCIKEVGGLSYLGINQTCILKCSMGCYWNKIGLTVTLS